MPIPKILATLILSPVELFYDTVCSFWTRLTGHPGAALLLLALTVCLLTTPLAPKTWKDFRSRSVRRFALPVAQGLCVWAFIRWFDGTRAFRGVSFGPLPDLGGAAGGLLFGGAYAVFALLRLPAGLGYRPMTLNAKQRKTDRNNRILMILCGAYMTLLTGLLIPSALIGASPAEFIDSHYYFDPTLYLVPSSLLAAGTFVLWGIGYGLLLSPKARKRYTLILAVLAAASAVNYMFFGKDYGFIASDLQFETAISNQIWKILVNAACVLLTGGAAALLFRKNSLILRLVCLYGCVSLAVMSVINITGLERESRELHEITSRIETEEASFRLDRTGKNVVVIMLDRAVSAFVPYIMNEKPELKASFDGFTWYPNTLSYGYHTNIASPALFGGYEYTPRAMAERDDLSLTEKHNEALKIMPKNFLRAGFEVTVCDAPYANYQWIPDLSIYDDDPEIRRFNTIGMFDEYKVPILKNLKKNRSRNLYLYSLFRSAPLILQGTIYDQGRYLAMDGRTDTGEGSELIGVSPDFLNSYMVMKNLEKLTEITEDGSGTFLMLTNEMTHDVVELQEPDYVPTNQADNTAYEALHGIRVTEDGREMDLTGEDAELRRIHYQCDMAAFIQLGAWFDELRAQGVYDNTRIILVSDHGCYLGMTGVDLTEKIPDSRTASRYLPEEWTDTTCYNPLLMVKDFGAEGFTTDTAFMTNAEVPALAFAGVLEDPVNPFTGNALTGEEMPETHYICESDWHTVTNCGSAFSDPLWLAFRGEDIFDAEGWSVLGDDAGDAENP